MPLFMDRHELEGATAQDLTAAHVQDVDVQDRHGVRYLTYWFDYPAQRAFCLVDAPDAASAQAVHAESHGILANRIIPVEEHEVRRFLGSSSAGDWPQTGIVGSAVRVIMFTDIVGSTALTDRLGDTGAMEIVRTHNRVVRDSLDRFGGREVKHTGDGIMASFGSIASALGSAVAVQERLAEAEERGGGLPVRVRIGLAAGEPVAEDDDLFGAAVQLAARLCDASEPGEVWVSNAVRELAVGKGFHFENRGPVALKGFPDPVPVAAVQLSRD